MFKSIKAQEMYSSVSPVYENNKLMKKIYELIGVELDTSIDMTDEILKQFFPQTATWGLTIWEKRLNIPSNINENIDIRRAKVISRLQSKNKIINPQQMATVISNYTKAKIDIIEDVAPYVFEIDLVSNNGFPIDLKELYKEIIRIKPSHLGVRYKLTSINQNKVFVASSIINGEEVTVYPWSPREIESRGKLNISLGHNSGVEDIVIYPRKER
ncbi:YmfQ family protein [Clostridium senegalense]|uniref:YmfQ family protein n=1 Tax=Clostridium senegalense TaxID=1465809 RepID=UPI000287EE85|nr:YmfQ family protein [Clostridium senegalense]